MSTSYFLLVVIEAVNVTSEVFNQIFAVIILIFLVFSLVVNSFLNLFSDIWYFHLGATSKPQSYFADLHVSPP